MLFSGWATVGTGEKACDDVHCIVATHLSTLANKTEKAVTKRNTIWHTDCQR